MFRKLRKWLRKTFDLPYTIEFDSDMESRLDAMKEQGCHESREDAVVTALALYEHILQRVSVGDRFAVIDHRNAAYYLDLKDWKRRYEDVGSRKNRPDQQLP